MLVPTRLVVSPDKLAMKQGHDSACKNTIHCDILETATQDVQSGAVDFHIITFTSANRLGTHRDVANLLGTDAELRGRVMLAFPIGDVNSSACFTVILLNADEYIEMLCFLLTALGGQWMHLDRGALVGCMPVV